MVIFWLIILLFLKLEEQQKRISKLVEFHRLILLQMN